MTVVPLLQLLLALSARPGAASAAPSQHGTLEEAVQLLDSFQDERAAAVLRTLLLRSPPGEVAAKAHLYLGLIAFNAFKPDAAKLEFRHALEANPAIDLPSQASPKARLAFGAVRHAFEAEVETGAHSPKRPAENGGESDSQTGGLLSVFPETLPASAAASPAAEVEQGAPSRSRAVAYVLGAATLVLAGLAVYGGVQLANYNSMIGTGNGGGSGVKPTYNSDQLSSAHGPATFWAIGWPVAAALGAAGLTGTVLTW